MSLLKPMVALQRILIVAICHTYYSPRPRNIGLCIFLMMKRLHGWNKPRPQAIQYCKLRAWFQLLTVSAHVNVYGHMQCQWIYNVYCTQYTDQMCGLVSGRSGFPPHSWQLIPGCFRKQPGVKVKLISNYASIIINDCLFRGGGTQAQGGELLSPPYAYTCGGIILCQALSQRNPVAHRKSTIDLHPKLATHRVGL